MKANKKEQIELPIKVAVYGTLKRGKGNSRLLSDSTFLGTAGTDPNFSMISFGGFPGVLDGNQSIHVEIFEVKDLDVLRRLDSLEGHPDFFEREEVGVRMDDTGEVGKAWMYSVRKHKDYYKSDKVTTYDENGRIAWRHQPVCPI